MWRCRQKRSHLTHKFRLNKIVPVNNTPRTIELIISTKEGFYTGQSRMEQVFTEQLV